jgi:hypothetical protein
VTIDFDIRFHGPAPVVAFNYAAPEWGDELNPPLPSDDAFVVRIPVEPAILLPGTYAFTTRLPFCPWWVSVDVQGLNFAVQGTIDHVCLPGPTICRGDLNCDGLIDFADISPFVRFLANYSQWQATYPGCPVENGDINCDEAYPSFGDINPFVLLLSTQPPPSCP